MDLWLIRPDFVHWIQAVLPAFLESSRTGTRIWACSLKRLLLLWERMVKWWHWVRSASNDPLLKAIFFFFRVKCIWPRLWKNFLFSGWQQTWCGQEAGGLAFFQAGLLLCIKSGRCSWTDQPWDLCSCCQCKDQLVPVMWSSLRRRLVHYKLVRTCRAMSCLSPRNYQRVMTLLLVCNWDRCEAMTQMNVKRWPRWMWRLHPIISPPNHPAAMPLLFHWLSPWLHTRSAAQVISQKFPESSV